MDGAEGSSSLVGKTIQRLIDSARMDAAEWMKQGDEIEKYTTSNDYAFLYQEFDADQSFKARVNKASEFCQIFGAFLYPHNPDATVNSMAWADQWARQRHQVEEQYADYSARHGDMAKHMRRCVDHSLLFGRGVLWSGFAPKKGIVTDVFDRSDHLSVDPDARSYEEQNWQARKRIKPRWELCQRYPESAAIIERLPVYSKPASNKKDKTDADGDLVCYYDVWMGVGASNYMKSAEIVEADKLDTSAKKKYCIADGHILHEGPWEIPFFMIDEWPGSYLDLIERPGCLYPMQPMEPGMGHLRAMNHAYTLFIAKWRLMCRTPFAAMQINGQGLENDALYKILRGEHLDIFQFKVNGDDNPDLGKYFQRIDWGDPVPGFERYYGLLASEFEKSTGLAEVLYAGQTSTQLRSAKAAELVEQNSRTRSDSMRESVTDFMERIFRKRLFAARFLHGSEDIAALFGPQAGAVWGELAGPEVIAQEQMARQQLTQQAAQMGVPPEQVDQALGPPQFVDIEQWIHEADRTIDAGSMRRMDIDAQVANLNVALNQLGPAVVNMPGGGEFVSAVAAEFAKINRFSPALVAAAENIATQIQMQQQMQLAQPTQTAPTPGAGPQTGPEGGTPPPAA